MKSFSLRAEHLTKDYPGTRALDDVSISFESGKVNALVGKNGSGKSTLIKIFSGAVRATSGNIYLAEEKMNIRDTADAFAKGIVTVYQEMSLIPWLSVTENIFLGRLPTRFGAIDWQKAHHMAGELLNKMQVKIDPEEILARLSMWQWQVVEITKALSFNPKAILLDEPTSALAHSEVHNLFDAVHRLREQGVVVVYVTHKLHELPLIADSVSVLRDGKLVGTVEMSKAKHGEIIHMMFGELKEHKRPKQIKVSDIPVMEIKGLGRKGWFEDVNFSLRRGEVLGIAGMLGSGRTELLRAIFGADPADKGEVIIEGNSFIRTNPIKMKKAGIGLTPEDRKNQGLILIHSVKDNLCYASMDKTANGLVENKQKRDQFARGQVEDLEIVVNNFDAPANSLSGGNQQKVVVGNWLNTSPKIMLYDEPSRGIDVNAKQQIFQIMWKQAKKGISSIFVSTELEELLLVCHRILVMRHGRMVGEVDPQNTTINQLYELCMQGE